MASTKIFLAVSAIFYLLLVRLLRYRRRQAIQKKHGMHKRSDFAALTADQAQSVLQELIEMEFPRLMGLSMFSALLKTYSIPTISSLLVRTALSEPETASKRLGDTGVLILEFCLNKQSSDRAVEAIARMNYLHSRHIKAGKISNDDLLYALSGLALETVTWIDRYEWRPFSDFERCAQGTFWKAMGDKMSIDFSALPSFKAGWTDGLHWLEEIRQWSEDYELQNVISAETNHKVALAAIDVLVVDLPKWLRIVGMYIVSVMIGERVREATMLPNPPWAFAFAIENLLRARQLLLRHLILPRPGFMRKKFISSRAGSDDRYSAVEYLSHPWYVKPTLRRRWGPKTWIPRLLGRSLPGDDGDKYRPEGYKILEVGPDALKTSGSEMMTENIRAMQAAQPGGCPFG